MNIRSLITSKDVNCFFWLPILLRYAIKKNICPHFQEYKSVKIELKYSFPLSTLETCMFV